MPYEGSRGLAFQGAAPHFVDCGFVKGERIGCRSDHRDAHANVRFAAEPERLWQMVLRRAGGTLALVATYPDDPALN